MIRLALIAAAAAAAAPAQAETAVLAGGCFWGMEAVFEHVQGVGEVVRGSDLADSTPRQLWLARALGLPEPSYAHVPLVLGPDGARLAKRHGAVTLREVPAARALAWMASSLGFEGRTARELLAEFDPARLPSADTRFEGG